MSKGSKARVAVIHNFVGEDEFETLRKTLEKKDAKLPDDLDLDYEPGAIGREIITVREEIQAVKDAGEMSIHPLASDKLQLQFRDYVKTGDVLSVYLDPSTNRLLGVRVSTYLEKPEDLVTLDVTMATLSDGATYPTEIVLVAQSKEIKVDIRNSGHRPMNPQAQ